ncbi:lipopolysaccharide biosynthesis protein [Mucilaginibacter paludis]|uniref:Multi antimicrobial extrusion protein MatE n=1 Tax=Mucilaginibacter paludis DSM 18603 TaxID=714943 RepID=H1Y002_9SPHI|nr:oligosaccharide flippase family protein [Mucilaginibacter paludis]EHQ27844.1 multi antimicrobial extrusion protein MatE [Mucilaginibacter paludis DSM 18603]
MGIIQQQTLKGTFYSYLGVLIGFITISVLQPHALTTEQVGLTRILLSFSLLFAQFAALGFNGTARYFPYFRDKEKEHHGYLFLSCLVSGVGMLLFAIGAYVFKDEVIGSDSSSEILFNRYYWCLIPLTFFTLYFNVFELYARVLYNAISGKILREFTKRLFVLIAVLAIYFKLVDFHTFIIIWLFANIVPTFIMLWVLIRDKHFFFKPNFKFIDKPLRSKLVNISFFFILAGSASILVDNIDVYIVNLKLGLSDTGIYAIASYFATLISLPARSLYGISGVIITDAWKDNDLDTIKSIYKKSCITQIITSLFLFIMIWANIDNIFHLLPAKYASGRYVIFFIGLGYLIDSAAGVNNVIISGSKYFRFDFYSYLVLIVIVVISNLIFIPLYGITGTAIASGMSLLIFNLFRFVFLLIVYKMQPFTIQSAYTLLMGVSIYFLSVWIVPHFDNFIVDLLVRSAFITILYGGCTYLFNLSDDITYLLKGYANKLLPPK